jgi:hypothetical protein
MSAADRYARARTPRDLSALSRPELAARIAALRASISHLWEQSERDGGPAFGCVGPCKVHLIELERDLSQRNRAAERGKPLTPPVALAAVGQRGNAPTGGAQSNRNGAYAPTERQVAFYRRLAESPRFSEEERRRSLDWLASKATRQTIKDQIDWLKRAVEERNASTLSRPDSVMSGQSPL